ncbi:MAG TPA: VOC family protein [Solirubrobacteraceae bacterium]|nr:VOC family protein [Solirubrobacteraceae bacterium]
MSEHLFAGIHVADLGASRDFYARLLGREPDLVPNEREAAWQLHEGAWIVLIAEEGTPGGAQHTLIVEDLDAFLAAARERGIEPGPVEPVGPDMSQSIVVDPDGNRLKVAARAGEADAAG